MTNKPCYVKIDGKEVNIKEQKKEFEYGFRL